MTTQKAAGEPAFRARRTDTGASGAARPGTSGAARPGASGAAVIAVTGAAKGVGLALLQRLGAAARECDGAPVPVGVDLVDPDCGIPFRRADLIDGHLGSVLADVDTVVHVAVSTRLSMPADVRRRANLARLDAVLSACQEAGVQRLVMLTSAAVYGSGPQVSCPLDEGGPLLAGADAGVISDLWLMEEHLLRARGNGRTPPIVVSVRPATIVGAGVESSVTRHFQAPRLLVSRDHPSRFQLVHVEDVVTALQLAARGELDAHSGVTVGCEGWLDPSQVATFGGPQALAMSEHLLLGIAERLHSAGVTPAPAAELRFALQPWIVSSAALRATGWVPSHRHEDVLHMLLDDVAGQYALAGRRLGRRDAAGAGVAGAAAAVVAALGAVALSRRRREG